MPSYRVTLSIGDLRPRVHPDRVVDTIAGPASALTTLEGTNLNVVAGQARVTIRFTGDDDAHAGFVAREVIASAAGIAEVRTAFVTRRDGNAWLDVDTARPLVDDPSVPLVLRHGYSAEQVRRAEAPHLLAGVPLMARASAGLAAVVRELAVGRRGGDVGGRVLVLVGPGNNGADALYAAAELSGDGLDVTGVAATGAQAIDQEAYRAAVEAGVAFVEPDAVAGAGDAADVVVDGLFGIGSAGRGSTDLREGARTIVLAVLPTLAGADRPRVVAVDVPSGVDADSGAVPPDDPDAGGPVVLPADVTVTFGGMKAGLLRAPARLYAGQVVIVDIGLGEQLATMEPLIRLDPSRDERALRPR